MKKSRIRYSKKFRENAVKFVKEHDGSLIELANKLNIHPICLSMWLHESCPGFNNSEIHDKVPLQIKSNRLSDEKSRLRMGRKTLINKLELVNKEPN